MNVNRATDICRTFRPCAKCGWTDVTVKWLSKNVTAKDDTIHGREHFVVTCSRCGYHWSEEIEEGK